MKESKITHLLTLWNLIEELDESPHKFLNDNDCFRVVLSYKESLAQPLTESMFHAKTGLFEGFVFNKEHNEFDNGTWRISVFFKRVFLEKYDGDYMVGSVIDNPTLSQLAEDTKDSPLKLRQ